MTSSANSTKALLKSAMFPSTSEEAEVWLAMAELVEVPVAEEVEIDEGEEDEELLVVLVEVFWVLEVLVVVDVWVVDVVVVVAFLVDVVEVEVVVAEPTNDQSP